MDLIYTDRNGKELGVILDYTLDIAFGRDENSFSLELDLCNHCCRAGYFVYLEGSEYGGIIDKIAPDTERQMVTYEGRTWHGILNGKIIEPEDGQDYLTVSGDANVVLAELITMFGLASLFTVSGGASAVIINGYQFERYTPAYVGILKMLLKSNGKLKISCSDARVTLEAVPLFDYSRNEEWDSGQMKFSITKDYRPVNHLICLGSGNLSERHVIHLFADENGGVRPYKLAEEPYRNAHYILDKSQQVLYGIEEVCEIYDYGNAQDTQNYVLLTAQPENWSRAYPAYYQKKNGEFKQLEREYRDVYVCLTSAPGDWEADYGAYFVKSGGAYKGVHGIETVSYSAQQSKPKDWKKNYKDYYYLWSDGITSEYRSVPGNAKEQYVVQTMEPSDWGSGFKNYYELIPTIVYHCTVSELGADGMWRKHTETLYSMDHVVNTATKRYTEVRQDITKWEYENLSGKKAPAWQPKKYYTKQSYAVAPTWKESEYYTKLVTVTAPLWEAGKYYSVTSAEIIPVFTTGKYYELFVDNYADLIAHGLKKMQEYFNCDSVEIKLDAAQEYDVNDVVGASEHITGISIFQPITKKIVKISVGRETIEYEIGE